MTPVLLAWGAEAAIITVRDLTGPKRFPLPSEFLATFVVFGGLSVLSESSTFRGAANATAWGLVLATLLSSKVDVLKPVGDFLSGVGPSAGGGAGPVIVSAPAGAAPVTNQGGSLLNAQKGF